MLAIVGLGNPGRKYRNTRHNLGFWVVDKVADQAGIDWRASPGPYWVAPWSSHDALLVKPSTYMNNSGTAVVDVLERYAVLPEQFLVVVDDVYLSLGNIRIRRKGSDGGHNGLASIIRLLEHGHFPRMRLGIGPQPEGQNLIEFVLSPFQESEYPLVQEMVERGAAAIEVFATAGIDAAMNQFNLPLNSSEAAGHV